MGCRALLANQDARRWLFAVPSLAMLALIYAFFATGAFAHPHVGSYYDWLARGFLQGQLHLPLAPSPELLALPDPYDPRQNANYRLHDVSLYNGRYYLYWGPLPALPRALWTALTNTSLSSTVLTVALGLLA